MLNSSIEMSSPNTTTTEIATHAALNTGVHGRVLKVKTSDQTVNNSTVFVSDTELLFPIGANESWEAIVMVLHNTGITPDLKVNFAVPSGCTYYYSDYEPDKTNPVGDIGFTGRGAATFHRLYIICINGATAGNVVLQWAQTTATVADSKVLAKAFLIGHQLA